jgi:hypothetical protein
MSDEKEREVKHSTTRSSFLPPELLLNIRETITGTRKGIDTCESITKNRSSCKGVSNIFVSGTKKEDCNWFCLKECTSEQLRPMFENLPSYLEVSDVKLSSLQENLPSVDRVLPIVFYWDFKLKITKDNYIKLAISKRVSENYFQISIFSPNRLLTVRNFVSGKYIAELCCSFLNFVKLLSVGTLFFHSTISFNEIINSGYNTWKFDKEYIRPINNWNYFTDVTHGKKLNEIFINLVIKN